MNRRSVVAAVAALALLGLTAGAQAGTHGKRRVAVQKFQVTAYPGLLACSMETDQYVTAVHRPFTAPANGTFHVIIGSFAGAAGNGDWDLYVLDTDGAMVDYDFTTAPTAEVKIPVKKKETLDIMMCNFDDVGTTADGIITFTYA
jgi:hypothetical protein